MFHTAARVAVRRLALILATLAILGGAACGSDGERDEVLVFAAASLTDVFTEMAVSFEEANRDIDVVLSFAGSSSLREQITAGAPADVFAAANETVMDQLVGAGEAAATPEPFARNGLVIATPADNPGRVQGVADFADPDLLLGLCAAGVPCGDLARTALDRAGVTPAVDTAEADVRALMTKIVAGELDAGIVYRTDVIAAPDDSLGIELPPEARVDARYPIVTLAGGGNPSAADRFVAYVLSPTGRDILSRFGFEQP